VKKIYSFLLLVAIMTLAPVLYGQSVYSLREGVTKPLFSLDYAAFKGDTPELNRLEIYYRVYNSDLLFVKKGEEFEADYEIVVAVYDKKGRPIASKTFSRTTTTKEYSRTMSSRDYRIGQVTFEVPPEEYKIQCLLTDKYASETYKREFKADLTEYDNRNPQVSEIEFVHSVEPAGEDTTFMKNGKNYIPDVRRIYGGDTTATVRAYFEIYQGSGGDNETHAIISLINFSDNIVYRDEETVSFDSTDRVPMYREIPLKDIKGGEYIFEVVLRGDRGRDVDKVEGPITIHWTPQAMILNDPEKAVEMIKYIATQKQMDAILDAENPADRLQKWNEFWKSLDPTPGTPDNEVKEDYFDRIEFADQNFSILQREGWRTDRGMIFIQYGPPDQIEDHPFEMETKAYQIWYYYRSGSQVREFLFIDEFGNNDYILQYPYDGIRY